MSFLEHIEMAGAQDSHPASLILSGQKPVIKHVRIPFDFTIHFFRFFLSFLSFLLSFFCWLRRSSFAIHWFCILFYSCTAHVALSSLVRVILGTVFFLY